MLVRTHNMANKGQGFSEKCRVAEKVETKEADAGGPTRISGDDMRMKKILFEGLRRDRCQSHLEDS